MQSLDSKLNACFFLAFKKHTENTKLTTILTFEIQFELNTPYILAALFYPIQEQLLFYHQEDTLFVLLSVGHRILCITSSQRRIAVGVCRFQLLEVANPLLSVTVAFNLELGCIYFGGSVATIILENPEMLTSKHYAKDKLRLKLTN